MTKPVASRLLGLDDGQRQALEEIRLRTDLPMEMVIGGRSVMTDFVPEKADMEELLASVSGYALYSCEMQMAQGYIAMEDGHRVGVCGRMARREEGQPFHMADVTSVCIRIARFVAGAGRRIYPHLLDEHGCPASVLLLGSPGCGKTTVLRDCALYLSDRLGLHVAVADERGELSCLRTAGKRIDVLSGADKAFALSAMIRTMAPQVLITDEIGREEDVSAILDAVRCGAGLIASAHADAFEDILVRPALRRMFEAWTFERYVLLGRRGAVQGVWNARGEQIGDGEERKHGDVGYGDSGHDCSECNRVSAFRRRDEADRMGAGYAPVPASDKWSCPL